MTTTTIRTRTTAPYVIAYIGHRGLAIDVEIVGYAHTRAAADKRVRRLGLTHTVGTVADGVATIDYTPKIRVIQ